MGDTQGEAGTPGSSGAGGREPGSSSGNNDATAANGINRGSSEAEFSQHPRAYLLRQLLDKVQALLQELQGMGASLHAVRPTRAPCNTLPAPSVISAITSADRTAMELLHVAQRLGLKTSQSQSQPFSTGSPAGMAEGGSSDGSSGARPPTQHQPQHQSGPASPDASIPACAPGAAMGSQQQEQQPPGAGVAASIGQVQAERGTVHESMVENVAATALAANGGSPAAAMLDLLQIMIKHRTKSLHDLLAVLHTSLQAELGPSGFQHQQTSQPGRDLHHCGGAASTVLAVALYEPGPEFLQHQPSAQHSAQHGGGFAGIDMLPPSDLDAMDLEALPALNTSLSGDMELAAVVAAEIMQGA